MRTNRGIRIAALVLAARVLAPAAVSAEDLRATVQAAHEHAAAALLGAGLPAESECGPNLLLCGQVVLSNLTSEDCALGNGDFVDFWFFPGQARQAVGVATGSDDFDTFLTLFDPNSRLFAFNDDSFGSLDSSLGAILNRSGLWAVGVSTSPGTSPKTGRYALALVCGGSCVPDATTLCLANRRFRVQAAWRNQFNDRVGFGRAIARSGVSGFFSFGDPANLELMVKVLDFGDTFKVFYGQLTNLQFVLQVTDTRTGTSKSYTNTPGDCGGIDGVGFAKLTAAQTLAAPAQAGSGCVAGRNALCLLNRRFRVEVAWRNQFDGSSGAGGAVPLSGLTGAFYFTDSSNLELLVKLIEFPDRIAVFYGTLSNLEYTIRVTDVATGTVKTYQNPAGRYCGGLDNAAF